MTLRGKDVDGALSALQDIVDEAFAAARDIETVVLHSLALVDPGAVLTRAVLADVEGVAVGAMTAPGSRIQGAGFVAAVGLLEPERWWLEWFIREEDGRPDRLDVPTDPDAMGFHDYETLTWYAVPRDTGVPHVTGPYVDNLCTDDYTLTFTRPVILDGRFVGVAGADVGVLAAERTLLPVLRGSRRRLAVVNADGRTLLSNTGELVCGDLLRGAFPERSLPDLPLRLVELPEDLAR